jgi:hypothetical protein
MLNGLQTLRDRAVETALRTLAAEPSLPNDAWAVAPEELREVSILWPERYQWPAASQWVDTILYALKKRVRVEFGALPHAYRGTVLFRLGWRGKSHDVAIDYSDYTDISEECAERCAVYFKMQHLREGYGRASVLPGGYVPGGRKIYLHLRRLQRLRDRREFDFDVYGRFSTEFAGETRRRAAEILSSQAAFRFGGGLKKVKYLDFLKEIARARVCIDLPGEGDFCFRLINYFAVGACVVGPRPRTVLNAPLLDRVHVAYTKDDLSDLVEVCRFYVENDREREEMCRASRRFFEQNLHADNLAAYYLRSCLDRLKN